MGDDVTLVLSEAVREALARGGLPAAPPGQPVWDVPKDANHGDYATNVAMLLGKAARRPPPPLPPPTLAPPPPPGPAGGGGGEAANAGPRRDSGGGAAGEAPPGAPPPDRGDDRGAPA